LGIYGLQSSCEHIIKLDQAWSDIILCYLKLVLVSKLAVLFGVWVRVFVQAGLSSHWKHPNDHDLHTSQVHLNDVAASEVLSIGFQAS